MDEIIHKKINEIIRNAGNDKILEKEDNVTLRNAKTVIEILLGHYHTMSHEQIRDELITILIGKYVI